MTEMAQTPQYFSEPYQQRLLELAGQQADGDENSSAAAILEQLNDRKFATSSTQPDEAIPYVRLGQPSAQRPVLYVPGFTEGIEAKAPLAVEMAKRGNEIILPGQNRKEILKDTVTGKSDATYSQARNYLDVLRAEGLDKQPGSVDVVTHSYGSLIFDAMQRIATEEGLPCFKDAKVVMLAPAGMNTKENLVKLAGRFARGMFAENFTDKDFPDEKGEMLKAGTANMLANVPRALREAVEMGKRRVDYERLLRSDIGQLAVFSYAKDGVFPDRTAQATVVNMFDAYDSDTSVLWATPISLQPVDGTDAIRGGRDASHNDEQFNPSRVAGAVSQILAA